MEKELEDYIVARCAKAFKDSDEYLKLQSGDCCQEELLDTALMMGYKKGAADMINIILKCSQKM